MANLNRLDPFSDSLEEAFQRIFGPPRAKVKTGTTDIEGAVQKEEQAREIKTEVAPASFRPYRRHEVPGEAHERQVPPRRSPRERATGPTSPLPNVSGRRGLGEIDRGD
jgi:hypothetical protein